MGAYDDLYLGPDPAEALVAELGEGTVVAPADLEYGDRVRVPGWHHTLRVCAVEVKSEHWVKVLWDIGSGWVPGPHTMFRTTERLVRLW